MAEQLKTHFNADTVRKITNMIGGVYPLFDRAEFIRESCQGLETLELLDRGRHVCKIMHRFLPEEFPQAADILIKSMDSPIKSSGKGEMGMSVFLYMPYGYYASEYGLNDFEAAMELQYQLTQRFTAEFCIRPFILKYPEQTLAKLHLWAEDASEHVRRLVSEGTRPLLPWSFRLEMFRQNPAPVIALLEKLKDDPSEYVRRSVANNLNDIGKDNPQILFRTVRRWGQNTDKNRMMLIRHALRSAVKRADPGALAILGFDEPVQAEIKNVQIMPRKAVIGKQVYIAFDVMNKSKKTAKLLINLKIYYIKSNGKASPKIFKLISADAEADGKVSVSKKISLQQMTTRRHYPGVHKVDTVINGISYPVGYFELTEAER